MITNYQVKQVRLLENQARIDSLKVIKLNTAIDTLNKLIELKNISLQNCDTIIQLQDEKINLQVDLINNRNEKLQSFDIERQAYKNQIRNRTLIIIGSAILNTIFIYKAIK